MPNLRPQRLAQLANGHQRVDLHARQTHGTFKTHAEAETKALEVADSAHEDAVIVEKDGAFEVVGIDELHAKLPGGNFDGELIREAPIVSFVTTDPTSGKENRIGRRSRMSEPPSDSVSAPSAASTRRPPTALDRYAERFEKRVAKVLGPEQKATLEELNTLIYALQDSGIDVTVEFDRDVFERADSFEGFKNMLAYALDQREALQQRSIREIAIVDEWDNFGGTRVGLDFDEEAGSRRLEIGDDFLDDWGQGLVDKSEAKITRKLGKTLS